MSDIVKVMEQFIRETRYPNLVSFCDQNREEVKSFIQHFETHAVAKANLQHKLKTAFFNVKGKRKRGPCVDVDLLTLFSEAKAESNIAAEGWNTLSSSVTNVSRTVRDRLENNDEEHDAALDEENQVRQPDDDIILSGINVSDRFKLYRQQSQERSEQAGFHVDADLHQLAALRNVILLKDNEYADSQVNCFGLETLTMLHETLLDKYLNCQITFETKIFNEITSVLRGLSVRTERRKIKQLINDIAKEASDEDDKLIDIIINCLNKLPNQERLGDDVGESELIGTYLDPVLSPIFHRPEENRHFRWLNVCLPDTESQRPDGNIFQAEQRRIHFSTGYVEVKPDKSRCQTRITHEDTLRLVNFCMDTLVKNNVKSMIAVQAVGYHVSVYLVSPETIDVCVMVELFSFNVPKCISELPSLIMHFDQLKRIMVAHETHCVLSNTRKRLAVDQPSYSDMMNVKKPKNIRPSLAFK
ncbi:uncharacterized protein EV154DRAFT_472758 [Mucor mucedo]|uniref:uncharacterized protein n=1 Tax=Mucor mucedo TaxID=29922 RepID=UPI0022202680|nr:uncharacterized protein EV154DRAFT_472758 [Mucor mucedo]KAI7875547.1 hypothetical protein EV154DRAFT_472758 [Mucor mucedo]